MSIHKFVHSDGSIFDKKSNNWVIVTQDGPVMFPNATRIDRIPYVGKLATYYVNDFNQIIAFVEGFPMIICKRIGAYVDTADLKYIDEVGEFESLANTIMFVKNAIFNFDGELIVGNVCDNIFDFIDVDILHYNCRLAIIRAPGFIQNEFVGHFNYNYVNLYVVDMLQRRVCMKVYNRQVQSGYNFSGFIDGHSDERIERMMEIMMDLQPSIISYPCSISNNTVHIGNMAATISDEGDFGYEICAKCGRNTTQYVFILYGRSNTCFQCNGTASTTQKNLVIVL